MAATRGVNDTAALDRIEGMMATGNYASEREAILEVFPGDGNTRRIQTKLKERRDLATAALKAELAAVHAAAYPASSTRDDGEFRLEVAMPLPGGGATLVVVVDAGGRGRRGAGLSANVLVRGDGPKMPPSAPRDALATLGLVHVPVDGVLADRWPACEAVDALGRALHVAWVSGGVKDGPDLMDEAMAHEAARIGSGGVDALREMVGDDGGRILACYADVPRHFLRTALVAGMDPARRSVLRALAAFGGLDVAATDPEWVAGYVGRPLELLVEVLDSRGVAPGRPASSADAVWLDALVGRRNVGSVPPGTLSALLRLRTAIDMHRCVDDADAAGLVDLVGAAVSRADDGLVADLLMHRLSSGPDACLGYGTLAGRLREAWDGDLAGAVAAVTAGVEGWCADVAQDLLVPGVLVDVALKAGDPKRAQRFVDDALVTARWLSFLESTARDMVGAGRGVEDLAVAVRRRGIHDAGRGPFRLWGSRQSEAVARLSKATGDGGLDHAWERHAAYLVPRWRVGGREAWADRVRETFGDAGAGGPTVVGGFRRGIRSLVGLVGAGVQGEGQDTASRLSGSLRHGAADA